MGNNNNNSNNKTKQSDSVVWNNFGLGKQNAGPSSCIPTLCVLYELLPNHFEMN